MPKVGFISLGCPKNLVDSEVMMGLLGESGHTITAQAEEAEVLVVNTCAFIESAQQESVDAILELAELKRSGRARRLIVTGCLVERYREQIQADIPEVDELVGTNELPRILAAVEGRSDDGGHAAARSGMPAYSRPRTAGAALRVLPQGAAMAPPAAATAAPDESVDKRMGADGYLYDETTPRLLSTARHTAYIKIAEGCDHPCSFCVIPQYRGQFRSRRPESVEAEARRLAANGTRELILVGQDTTSYGEDLGMRHGLAQLLARLAAIEELRWIRTLYFYPNRVTAQLLETLAAHPRLCRYLDMPLQHASGEVLARMRRGGSGEHFLKLIARIRATLPGVALRSTFITGFPGESEADFQTLCDFVEAAEFDWLGVFPYSDETSSGAHALDKKVAPEIATERRERLMKLQRKISRRLRRRQVGTRQTLLVEGPSEESDWLWQGRLETQAPGIDGKVLINDFDMDEPPQPGSFAQAEITAAHDYDVVARLTTITE